MQPKEYISVTYCQCAAKRPSSVQKGMEKIRTKSWRGFASNRVLYSTVLGYIIIIVCPHLNLFSTLSRCTAQRLEQWVIMFRTKFQLFRAWGGRVFAEESEGVAPNN
jgi:hypothetical protein